MGSDLRPAVSSTQFLRGLLAAKDPTQALHIATDHVARVLDCMVSWAGLVDGDYLVMGAHHGVESTEMAAVWRLQIGEGIGGRVALERRPHMSRDYRHDSRRAPLMKRLIDHEGIQAALVVPILVAESVLGVLYAAHRQPYTWTDAELATIEEIAHDLGVRLRQLDVDGRRESLAQVAEQTAERALHHTRACARLASNFAQQTDPVAALDLLARELGCRVELRQGDGALVRASGELGEGNPRVISRTELPDCDGLTVVAVHTKDQDDTARSFIELCVGLFQLQLLRVSERERTTERLTGELFDELLSGRVSDPDVFRTRLCLIGVTVEAGSRVLVVGGRRSVVGPERGEKFARLLLSAFPGSVTVERGGRLVAVIHADGRSGTQLRAQIAEVISRVAEELMVGIGRVCSDLMDFSTSYDEARAACELALRGEAAGPVVTAHELGIMGMASLPAVHLRTTVRDVLGPLLELDEQRGTDLVSTLRSYLVHDRHLPDTAAALHVHYNTVRNRIARIESVLGVDMRDVDDRFRIETALRMHALSRALGHAG